MPNHSQYVFLTATAVKLVIRVPYCLYFLNPASTHRNNGPADSRLCCSRYASGVQVGCHRVRTLALFTTGTSKARISAPCIIRSHGSYHLGTGLGSAISKSLHCNCQQRPLHDRGCRHCGRRCSSSNLDPVSYPYTLSHYRIVQS
jgi:hypothetical protein